MEIVYERVAAIDVGKKIIAVAVRTPGQQPGKRRQQVRKYNTFHQTLEARKQSVGAEQLRYFGEDVEDLRWQIRAAGHPQDVVDGLTGAIRGGPVELRAGVAKEARLPGGRLRDSAAAPATRRT